MKPSYVMAALVALLTVGSANASLLPGNAIYSSYVTSKPDQSANSSWTLKTGISGSAGSPLAQEFNVTAPVNLVSLDLRLSDATALTDGGSILVYLVADSASGTLPATVGSTNELLNPILLGTIFDYSLPISGSDGCVFGGASATLNSCNTLVSFDAYISTPGDYWIALVDGSDTLNGGKKGSNSSNAVWWKAGDSSPLGGDVNNAHVNAAGVLTPQASPSVITPFELQINAPEPASLALLGSSMIGLGFVRRRLSKKSVG